MSEFNEPWRYDEEHGISIDAQDEVTTKFRYQRRIAVCVNALAGVSTDALEAGALRALTAALRSVLAWGYDPETECHICGEDFLHPDDRDSWHADGCPVTAAQVALAPFAALEVGP